MEALTVPELLRRSTDNHGNLPALVYKENQVSYSELASLVQRAAGGLAELGICAGDRVAFWLPNCPAYVVLYLACVQLDAIAVAVNTRFRSAEVADIIARSGASCLILWPQFRNIDFLQILKRIDSDALQGVQTAICYSEDEIGAELSSVISHVRQINYTDLIQATPLLQDYSNTGQRM